MLRHIGLAVGALATVASAAQSCAVQGFELVVLPESSSGGEAGATAGGTTQGGGPSVCKSVRPPSPPAGSDPGPDVVDVVLAVRSFDFGEDDLEGGAKIGFDLDERCTCHDESTGPSCKPPGLAKDHQCDGPGGIDGAVASLFKEAKIYDKRFDSAVQSQRAEDGSGTLLIRVRGYNAQPNDESVTVSVYPSGGLNDDPCNPDDAKARWDGTDAWPIDTSSLNPLQGAGGSPTGPGDCGGGVTGYDFDDPAYVDPNAYVTGSLLVAALPTAGMIIADSGGTSSLKIVQGFLAGRLEQQNDGWHLVDATLAGRWPVKDFFATLSTLTIAGDPLCTDHFVFGVVKQLICSYPDITKVLPTPTMPCDAMSMGVALSAQEAKLGIAVSGLATPTLCSPGTDPAGQSCE